MAGLVYYRNPHPRRWRGMAHWDWKPDKSTHYWRTRCSGWDLSHDRAVGVPAVAVAPTDRCRAGGCGEAWKAWLAAQEEAT